MSQYAKAAKTLADAASDPALSPCLWCKTPTKRTTLSDYGARCFECFLAYCRDPSARLTEHRNRTVLPVDKPAVSHEPDPARIAAVKAAKAEAQRKAAEYAAARGLDLTLKKPVVVDEASSMPPEPERFAQEDEAS